MQTCICLQTAQVTLTFDLLTQKSGLNTGPSHVTQENYVSSIISAGQEIVELQCGNSLVLIQSLTLTFNLKIRQESTKDGVVRLQNKFQNLNAKDNQNVDITQTDAGTSLPH